MAVSPNPPDVNRDFREKNGLTFAILADRDMTVTDKYGIRHVGVARGNDLPHPTTFVIDADGVLRETFFNETYRVRPKPDDVLAGVKRVAV